MGLFLWSEMESLCLEVEGVSLGFEDVNGEGGVWFVFSNNHFQFLNKIICMSIYFFTHTYFHKYFHITIFSF